MLKFDVYRGGKPAADTDLSGAYVFGQDAIPVRADLVASGNQISIVKRVPGAVGLAILWDAGSAGGAFLLSTTRMPERAKPYNLNLELARGQLARISQKREEWGLFDFADADPLNRELDAVREKFIAALKCSEPAKAALLADEALTAGITLGERVSLFHADILLGRRRAAGVASRIGFGCAADLFFQAEGYADRIRETFDFINLPMPWKHIEPKERVCQYTQIDAWVNWAARVRKPVHAGPLLSFEPACMPEWMYLWENDYEALRDVIYEHIQRVMQRYEKHVRLWNVVSGIHAFNSFNLSFEQLMELTRLSCLQAKKISPRSQVMIELAMPWGEYYARNQRTIPPLLYADMAVQSGIKFDCFGVQVFLGAPADGYYVRDLMQISSLLDEFVSFSKPLHITACGVPSDIAADPTDRWKGAMPAGKAGQWHTQWSQRLQAEWLQAFYRLAMSKPYVESVSWRDVAEYDDHFMPNGGLCKANLEPKLAYRELRNFKSSLASPADSIIDQQKKPSKA